MQVKWEIFKAFVVGRSLSIQWVDLGQRYAMKAFDNAFALECEVHKELETDDNADFETNYKAAGNQSPKTEVTTQFEKRDKTLKLASAQADVDSGSLATILIKIPGTPGSADGRWIGGGTAWFDDQHKDDRIMSVEFTDEDNILGYGVGTMVGSYTDSDVDAAQKGWRLPNKRGTIDVEALGGYGFAPAGFYLKIVGKKGGSLTTGTFYLNINWGKQE